MSHCTHVDLCMHVWSQWKWWQHQHKQWAPLKWFACLWIENEFRWWKANGTHAHTGTQDQWNCTIIFQYVKQCEWIVHLFVLRETTLTSGIGLCGIGHMEFPFSTFIYGFNSNNDIFFSPPKIVLRARVQFEFGKKKRCDRRSSTHLDACIRVSGMPAAAYSSRSIYIW